MHVVTTAENQHPTITGGPARDVLNVHQVWLAYFALGGLADEAATAADLNGIQALAPGERDRLSVAVSEHRGNLHLLPGYGHSRLNDPAGS